jgi:hypothetical protein
MAKARSLVGLDVHATKTVAAVLDAETGELQWFRVGGGVGEAAGLCAGLPRPVRAAYEAGPSDYGWHASCNAVAWRWWSRRRARCRGRRAIVSRPIAATRSTSCGCCWPASCTRSG